MEHVPRQRPPYLQRQTTRHGGTAWYVRVGRGPLIRIRGEYGSPDFMVQYEAAVRGDKPREHIRGVRAGSLAWLIDRYRDSSDWTGLSIATRRQRENIFRQIIKSAGSRPYTQVTEATIAAGRDRRSQTPFQARHFLDTMRGLFAWAKEAKFVNADPAIGVKYPKLRTTDGFPVWTEDDVSAYEARWPMGTRQRVWLALLLFTGLRRGDAVRLGRQHVRGGVASIKTAKSNFQMSVTLPLLPDLVAALEAGPTAELAYICGSTGKPMTKESFGNAFSEACRAAGVRKSAHGLRKIGATRAALRGATVAQLNAIFGWTGSKMASLYTQSADRSRLARDAISFLANDPETSMLLPDQKVRASGQKQE